MAEVSVEIREAVQTVDEVKRSAEHLEKKLNTELGFYWWKKYVAAAFWSNVAMPVNLAITLMTALTTAQVTTDNLLSEKHFVGLSVSTLVLSVLNTFFRPYNQMTENIKTMNKWAEFGNKFEEIYYSDHKTLEDFLRRLHDYESLHREINQFQNMQSPDVQNFFTDMIHVVVRYTMLKQKEVVGAGRCRRGCIDCRLTTLKRKLI